jgi:hypothetical protein
VRTSAFEAEECRLECRLSGSTVCQVLYLLSSSLSALRQLWCSRLRQPALRLSIRTVIWITDLDRRCGFVMTQPHTRNRSPPRIRCWCRSQAPDPARLRQHLGLEKAILASPGVGENCRTFSDAKFVSRTTDEMSDNGRPNKHRQRCSGPLAGAPSKTLRMTVRRGRSGGRDYFGLRCA